MTPARRFTLIALLGLLLVQRQGCSLPIVGPIVAPAPIAESGLRVLIIEETNERISLSPGKREAILSTAPGSLREYCKRKCVAEGFYVIDQNDDVSRMPAWVQTAWSRQRGKLPWIIASNGKTGFEGELPDGPQVVAAVKKLGGE